MKKSYAVSILALMMVLLTHNGYSQNFCLTQDMNIEGERAFNAYVEKFKAQRKHLNTDLKIIPTVIHVIYRNTADRLLITRARINEQIEVTNKQMRRLNANAINTRPMFVNAAADCNIQVALATRKPDRSRFDGVIYHHYPNFELEDLKTVKEATILDPKKYLNVWVIPESDEGSAIFPWDRKAADDGFFISYVIFGTTGPDLKPLQSGGATFTHEVAHYLGVLHTFDKSGGYYGMCDPKLFHDKTIGDFCADTPLDPIGNFASITEECNDGTRPCLLPPFDNGSLTSQTENYMFYNRDSCLNMFSQDQRARMRACLYRIRASLVSFPNLLFTGVEARNHKDLPVEKPALEKNITIYPNPTNRTVHLNYHDLSIKDMSLKVYDQMGVKLKEVHSHTAISEVSLGSFPAGVYYLTITINNASVTKYLIKSE